MTGVKGEEAREKGGSSYRNPSIPRSPPISYPPAFPRGLIVRSSFEVPLPRHNSSYQRVIDREIGLSYHDGNAAVFGILLLRFDHYLYIPIQGVEESEEPVGREALEPPAYEG